MLGLIDYMILHIILIIFHLLYVYKYNFVFLWRITAKAYNYGIEFS